MQIEDFIKHGPHCLAGKYSTMGRCSCGAQAALEELAALRQAAQHRVQSDKCPLCNGSGTFDTLETVEKCPGCNGTGICR